MFLRTRIAESNEIPELFLQHGRAFSYPPDLRAKVPAIWQTLARDGRLRVLVYEDLTQGTPVAVGISASTFVRAEFMRECIEADMPYLGERFARWFLEDRCPSLREVELREANAGDGLHCLYLVEPMAHQDLSWEDRLEIDGFFGRELEALRSVNLREFMMELRGPNNAKVAEHCGTIVRSGYETWRMNDGKHVPEGDRPYLIGLNRSEAMRRFGSHAASFFVTRKARFGFTKAHQDLLRLALDGETDTELAMSLFLTLSAVKKRWAAIYGLVDEAMPQLLPKSDLFAGDSTRGAEKRRHLLSFLRQHPEELEPLNAVERAADSSRSARAGGRQLVR